MDVSNFIIIGENIHCSRSVKRGGKKMTEDSAGAGVIFKYKDEDRVLPVPVGWATISPDYEKGKCKHRWCHQCDVRRTLGALGEEKGELRKKKYALKSQSARSHRG